MAGDALGTHRPPFSHLKNLPEKGSFAEREIWTHEERNAAGELVATYESWANSDLKGGRGQHGWRKRAADGTLLEEHHDV